jgi:hypothetical protein
VTCGYPIADSQSGGLYPARQAAALTCRTTGAGFTLESEILVAAAALGCRSVAIPIDAVYPAGSRRSHFRPGATSRDQRMLGRHLLAQG